MRSTISSEANNTLEPINVFNKHSNLEGRHALLSPSKWYWLNYDDERMLTVYENSQATLRGTELHDFAARCIKLHQPLPRNKKTLNQYVNDAIGFHMTPEQTLYYSDNCFGTADAISFNGKTLRIHDLKTGTTPAHIEQLIIYAALFFMEYPVKPEEVTTVLRIYQNSEIVEMIPSPEQIVEVIKKIVHFDKLIKAQQDA